MSQFDSTTVTTVSCLAAELNLLQVETLGNGWSQLSQSIAVVLVFNLSQVVFQGTADDWLISKC